jgi:hypothetical protein
LLELFLYFFFLFPSPSLHSIVAPTLFHSVPPANQCDLVTIVLAAPELLIIVDPLPAINNLGHAAIAVLKPVPLGGIGTA